MDSRVLDPEMKYAEFTMYNDEEATEAEINRSVSLTDFTDKRLEQVEASKR